MISKIYDYGGSDMRVVLIVLFFFCFFAQAKDLVDTYRYQGIDEVEKKIQKYLQSKIIGMED